MPPLGSAVGSPPLPSPVVVCVCVSCGGACGGDAQVLSVVACGQVGGVVRVVPLDPPAVRRVRVLPHRAARGRAPPGAAHSCDAASDGGLWSHCVTLKFICK